MEEKQPQLTQAQKQRVIDWLKRKNVTDICPACGGKSWFIGDHQVMVHQFPKDYLSPYTMVPVMCNNCGYVMLFTSKMMGLD